MARLLIYTLVCSIWTLLGVSAMAVEKVQPTQLPDERTEMPLVATDSTDGNPLVTTVARRYYRSYRRGPYPYYRYYPRPYYRYYGPYYRPYYGRYYQPYYGPYYRPYYGYGPTYGPYFYYYRYSRPGVYLRFSL